MTPTCAVFDFDGTLTDLEHHTPTLHDVAQEALACLLAIPKSSIRARWEEESAVLDATPLDAAWVLDGHQVASLRSDPYVWANAITRGVLLATMKPSPSQAELDALVYEVHRESYAQARAPFREAACDVLDELIARDVRVFIVTNSDGKAVHHQLDQLGLRARDRIVVQGGAGKFVICEPKTPTEAFSRLAPSIRVPGMQRPVLLRRGQYYDALRRVWSTFGGAADDTLVCGDIFEIDLALPAALGSAIHLVTRSTTLAHELRATRSQPRGSADGNLRAVLERFVD